MITIENINKAFNYREYLDLLEKLLADGKTTGTNQSADYLDYAKINLQRMRRLDKTVMLNEALRKRLGEIKDTYTFVTITEGWCGDAAQNIPVFAAIEKDFPNFQVKLLLRDENPGLMDQYLTKGSRSIPKVICVDQNLAEKFNWGPRPAALQVQVEELLKNHATKEDKGLFVQNWYNQDKTQEAQREILSLLGTL